MPGVSCSLLSRGPNLLALHQEALGRVWRSFANAAFEASWTLVKPRLGLQMACAGRSGGDPLALLWYIGWSGPTYYYSESPAGTMPADLSSANAQVGRRTWEADWDLRGTVQYICAGGFQRVALQFPDELLKDAVLVTRDLQRLCSEQSSGCQVRTIARPGNSKQKMHHSQQTLTAWVASPY